MNAVFWYWTCFLLSGVVYAASFLFHAYLWWAVMLFPVLFFYTVRPETFSFKHGCIWALCTLSVHLWAGLYVLSCMAQNSWIAGCAVGLSILLLQSVSAGFIFACAGIGNADRYTVLKAYVLMAVFLLWIDRFCLIIFDEMCGYPLINPLILYMHNPCFLWFLPYTGKTIALLLFLLIAWLIAYVIKKRSLSAFIFLIALLVGWYRGFLSVNYGLKPLWIDQLRPFVYHAHHSPKDEHNAYDFFINTVAEKSSQYKNSQVLVFPESTIKIAAFNDDIVAHSKTLQAHCIFGASHPSGNGSYNSFVCIDFCKNKLFVFNKRHAMLFSERLPSIFNNEYFYNLYFSSDRLPLIISDNIREPIHLEGSISFVPYLCSELFFCEYPDDNYHNMPIIALVNDSVFTVHASSRYMIELLQLLACFKAVAWQRDIVYISYTQSFCCTQRGAIFTMAHFY